MPRNKKYDDLLKQAKTDAPPDEEVIRSLSMKVKPILNQLGSDLHGVRLTDAGLVQKLVEAKFAENDLGVEVTVQQSGEPLDITAQSRVGSVILGIYVDGAFNVEAQYTNGGITVYCSPVPKGGNLRQ